MSRAPYESCKAPQLLLAGENQLRLVIVITSLDMKKNILTRSRKLLQGEKIILLQIVINCD